MPLTTDQLTGYLDEGLDADLARWFPGTEYASVPEDTRPVEPFLARLPPAARAATAAFDRRVRAGRMPAFLDIHDWSYAFEFAENDCQILDTDHETELTDDDVWSVGADGGGNYYVVLTDGKVAVWSHEEEAIEEDTQFDNLDVYVWSLVRYHAIRRGVLRLADVEADFQALGQPGALAETVGLLATLPS
ncbi:hypothetical protein DF268_03885 [Streptomyces sp. V2]|uniref:hypothetical protein n=1 Tax=Streptomyces TaxID=1883 RepID=UPI000D670A0B|nr:hypothetical protein [Streptomyces sp. V2]PWG14882.1 hypothetical protein DF268_03885 [Streptomyces sp. V2]